MPYRLQAPVWRGLLARGAMLDARAEILPPFSALLQGGNSQEARMAVDFLHRAARHGSGHRSDLAAVRAAERHWIGELRRLLTEQMGEHARAVLGALATHGAASYVDPYVSIFDAVCRECSLIYGAAWPADVTFAILPLAGHPRAGGDPYALTAQTRFLADGKVVVELHLQPDGLGPEAYAVIPAVLLHECFCHVPSMPFGEVNNDSPFAEGFMDWAASYYLDHWLPRLHPRLAPSCAVHAPLHAAFSIADGDDRYSPWLLGKSAAHMLVEELKSSRRMSASAARHAVASMALSMNVHPVSLAEKDLLMMDIATRARDLTSGALAGVLLDDDPPDALF